MEIEIDVAKNLIMKNWLYNMDLVGVDYITRIVMERGRIVTFWC